MTLVATESQYKILERINPLQTTLIERSIVSSRVALLLRSAEIKLLFSRFVFFKHFPCDELVKETDETQGCWGGGCVLMGSIERLDEQTFRWWWGRSFFLKGERLCGMRMWVAF